MRPWPLALVLLGLLQASACGALAPRTAQDGRAAGTEDGEMLFELGGDEPARDAGVEAEGEAMTGRVRPDAGGRRPPGQPADGVPERHRERD